MSTNVNIFRNTHSSSSSGGGKEEQTKSVTITENGTTTITPDEGKTLSRVNVNTAVTAQAVGKGVFYRINGGEWTVIEGVVDVDFMDFHVSNDSNKEVCVTTDGQEPIISGFTNILFRLIETQGKVYSVHFVYYDNERTYNGTVFIGQ